MISYKLFGKINNQYVVFLQITIVLLGVPVFLFLDSPWVTPYFSYGQDLANTIMIGMYSWILLVAKRRLYWLMLLMTIGSLVAEMLGSWLLVLYQYRLHNIPLYIPLGHAVIYASAYHIGNNPWIWRHRKKVEQLLSKSNVVVILMSLFVLNDVAGFLFYLLFLLILHKTQKKLFYLSMFTIVYYIELFGTVYSTWAWYGVLGNHPSFPLIGFTPSGVAGLYALIDLGSNSIYLYIRKILNTLCKFFNWTVLPPFKNSRVSLFQSPA